MSKKSSAMDAATKMGQFGFGYGHKIQSRNPIKYFIMAKQIICYRPLQVLASLYLVILYIFILYTYILVWYLWMTMEESGPILVSRVFVVSKQTTEESLCFCL